MEIVDIAIIGAGPAGVSAALNAKIRKKSFYLFGNTGLSHKVERSEKILNYPGIPDVSGAELNTSYQRQLDEMEIEVLDSRISMIYKMKDYFSILADKEYRAKTVILATGVETVRAIEGERELTGRGVSYCATCDGGLYRNRVIGVVCESEDMEHEAEFLLGLAGKMYYWPLMKESHLAERAAKRKDSEKPHDGETGRAAENSSGELEAADYSGVTAQEEQSRQPEHQLICPDKRPVRVLGQDRVEGVELADGEKIALDGIFFLKQSLSPAVLMSQLELEDGHIPVNRQMETALEGCFAAGDCTGRPYQLAKAVGEGNIAAHSAIEYLAHLPQQA